MPSLILYNIHSDPETIKYKGNLTNSEDILEFCNLNSLETVTEYTEENSYRLFAGAIPVKIISFFKFIFK